MTDSFMYPPLGPVKAGDMLRFEASGDPDAYLVTVSRVTEKLIYVDDGWSDGKPAAFSREHGAMFMTGHYDAYAGRLRQPKGDEVE